MDLKSIAALAVAEDSAEDTALEVALEYLKNEPTPPPRCRYPKVPMPSERRGASAATPAEDAEPTPPLTDLQKHDRRFHPKGYKKGESCKYRERLDAGDDSDASLAAAEKEESGHLPLKKRDEYLRLMEKKHPELDAGKLLSELGKIADRKIQSDAFAWAMRGAVRLPEDLYKVEQARELAEKAKKDPFSFDTPQACINDLLGKGHKVSLKPITVEELKKNPLMSDYKKLPHGVETFEVDDSREGQELMREVIDTHWGEDANPWCLLARKKVEAWERMSNREDYDKAESWWGNLSRADREKIAAKIYKPDTSRDIIDEFVGADSIVDAEGADTYFFDNVAEKTDDLSDAWDYWNHYNALPKRVAFKDGKLLAFMATHAMDEDEAFDDAAYGTGGKLPDMYPDEYKEYEDWEETEEGQEESANFFEWLRVNYPELISDEGLREHTAEEWWDRQDRPHKGIPLGNIPVEGDPYGRWADVEIQGGKAMPIMTYSHYTIENGKPVYSIDWHKGENGSNGYVSWYDNGQKKEEIKDGKTQEWYDSGSPKRITESDFAVSFNPDGSFSGFANYGTDPVKEPTNVSLWPDGSIHSIKRHIWKDGGGYNTDVYLDRNGSVLAVDTPDSANRKDEELQSALAVAHNLLAEAKRRFPNGGKQPAPSTDGRVALDQFPTFNPASFAAYLAKH